MTAGELEAIRNGSGPDCGLEATHRSNPAVKEDHPLAVRLEDAYFGEYLAKRYLPNFVYAPGLGWLEYDGRRWSRSATEVVGEAVRRAVIEFHTCEAKAGQDHRQLRRIDALLSMSKLRALEGIARNHLCRRAEQFDSHPDLLNVRNGVVDLRDGSLSPHDASLMLTKITMVDYVPEANHADWYQALDALPGPDAARWLQVRLGQGLSGHPTPDDRLVVFKGSGSNGKTTILDAVRDAAGDDYAVTMPDRVLLARAGDHPTELMVLRGARLAFMEEFPEMGHLNVKRLKDLHGTGRMSARYCRKDTVQWSPSHTAFVTTNYLPRVDESDAGTWRRLSLLEFPYRYCTREEVRAPLDRKGDANLRERLRSGRDGQRKAVLAWLVEGAVRWYQNDCQMPKDPKCVREATERWRRTADLLMRYIGDRLVFDSEFYVASAELYQDFGEWLKNNGHHPWTNQSFTARLSQHSEVVDHDVVKRVVRQTSAGHLSRPQRGFTEAPLDRPLGQQFTAWIGLRFRNDEHDSVDS